MFGRNGHDIECADRMEEIKFLAGRPSANKADQDLKDILVRRQIADNHSKCKPIPPAAGKKNR